MQLTARRAWAILVVWAAGLALVQAERASSWRYFDLAARSLAGRDGLRLFDAHPELQFGPLSVAAAALVRLLPAWWEEPAAVLAGSALGFLALVAVVDLVGRLHPGLPDGDRQRALLAGGLPLLFAWNLVAVRAAHLDDALALALVAGALAAIGRRRPEWVVLALAAAALAKPWAIVVAPLVAVLPGPGRIRRAAALVGFVALGWLPFVLAAPSTLRSLGRFTIENHPASALRALGVDDPLTPTWLRPTQLLLGLAVVAVLVVRRRWTGATMAGVGARLLLEPGVRHYYTAGLALGVLVWELTTWPRRPPWTTIAVVVALDLTKTTIQPPEVAGAIRLLVSVAAIALPLAGPAVTELPDRPSSLGPGETDVVVGGGTDDRGDAAQR